MRNITSLIAFLLVLGALAPKVHAQSPASAELNKLKFNLNMLNNMEKREDWGNKSWVMRYEKYVVKAEASLKAIQEKDPSYDLNESNADVAKRREKLDAGMAEVNAEKQAAEAARKAESDAAHDKAMAEYNAEQAEKARENEAAKASTPTGTSKGGPVYGERPEGTIMIWVRNQCTTRTQFCLNDGSSQTVVGIGPNEWSMKYVKPGTKVCQVSNNRCGTVVGTATKEEQEINVSR